jgi:hypothetical protein
MHAAIEFANFALFPGQFRVSSIGTRLALIPVSAGFAQAAVASRGR